MIISTLTAKAIFSPAIIHITLFGCTATVNYTTLINQINVAFVNLCKSLGAEEFNQKSHCPH